MAESEKRGFFGRLFGGKKERPAEEPENRSPDTETPDTEAPDTETPEPTETAADDPERETREPEAQDAQALSGENTDPAGRATDAPDLDDRDGDALADQADACGEMPATPDEAVRTADDGVTGDVSPDDAADLRSAQTTDAAPAVTSPADAEPLPEGLADAGPAIEADKTTAPEAGAPETVPTDNGDGGGDENAKAPQEPLETPPAIPAIEAEAEMGASADSASDPALDATAPAPRRSWFQRLRDGLSRSSSALGEGLTSVFRKRKLDAETLEDLEDLLIQADLGTDTAVTITERLAEGRFDKEISEDEVRSVLAEEIEKVLLPVARPLDLDTGHKPHVVLLVGVNGTGKTTTIGKLAAKLAREGKTVTLAAGDTFRAAAVEQLKIWGERTGSTVVARPTGADAAGLVFDAMKQAQAEQSDVLLIDTAGRLQNRAELMAELEKVVRVIKKHDPDAPHTVLLTLDATTGQNAMSQVEIFARTAGVTGLVMTKLDGTARGGILVAIAAKHALPVHFIGIGEGIDDLEPFEARDFAQAIAGMAR